MTYEVEGYINLENAESLLLKAKVAENDTEIQNLIFITEASINDLFTDSYPNKPNPAIYKTLNNTLSILKDKNLNNFTQNKFSFKNKREKPLTKRETEKVTSKEKVEELPKDPEFQYDENCTIKNFRDKRIFKFKSMEKMGRSHMENIENCQIVLLNVVESSFFYNIKNSIIWVAVSKSSTMLENVSDSVVITCSRQLRISNSKNVKFFINTVTPPIIEMSTNLTFSLNHLTYDGFDHHIEMSGLKGEFLENQNLVKDFSWHLTSKSPNWETSDKKPEHLATIIKLNDECVLNNETFSENDWKILLTLQPIPHHP